MANQFVKHPAETYTIGMDYSEAAPEGAALISGTWEAIDESDGGIDVTNTLIQAPSAVIDEQVAKCRVRPEGVLNHRYRLSITAAFNNGDILQDRVYMFVRPSG